MKCRYCKNNTLREEDGEQFTWCEVVLDNLDIDKDRECGCYRAGTNADRIRAMTDEELAEMLNPTASCTDCPVDNRKPCGTDGRSCRDRVLDWLRQEAREEQ